MANRVDEIQKTCHRWNIPWEAHELTFSCYRRQAFLGKDRTREYLAEAIIQARQRIGFHVWAYVIMPEHVHLLIWPAREDYSISAILQSIKQSVSRRAMHWLKTNHPSGLRFLATGQKDRPYNFWQEGGGYDRNVRTAKVLLEVFNYIHDNPVKRGLVSRPEEWTWSSYRDWEGLGAGRIPLDKESCLNSMA